MIEQGTWPSQEWRLPPKQQDGGSNPPVPAIVFNFSDYSTQSQEFKSDKLHSTRSATTLILDFLILPDDKSYIALAPEAVFIKGNLYRHISALDA